jgi:putative endonuclease
MPPSTSYHVYILVSEKVPGRHYTGCTTDVEARLAKHNKGDVSHTSKYRPWRLETVISFQSKEKARAFEAYLKSGSGRAFATRHF